MRMKVNLDVQGATREGKERAFHSKVGTTTREREKAGWRAYRWETEVEIEEYSSSDRPVAVEATLVTREDPIRFVMHEGRVFRDASSGGSSGTLLDIRDSTLPVFDLDRLRRLALGGRIGELAKARGLWWRWDVPERLDGVESRMTPGEAGVVAFERGSILAEAERDAAALARSIVLVDGRPHVPADPPVYVVRQSYARHDPPSVELGDTYPSVLEACYHPDDVSDVPGRRGDIVVHDPSAYAGWTSREGCVARTLAPLVHETWSMLGIDRKFAAKEALKAKDWWANLPPDWTSGTEDAQATAKNLLERVAGAIRADPRGDVRPLSAEVFAAFDASATAREELHRDGSSSRKILLADLAAAEARVETLSYGAAMDALEFV